MLTCSWIGFDTNLVNITAFQWFRRGSFASFCLLCAPVAALHQFLHQQRHYCRTKVGEWAQIVSSSLSSSLSAAENKRSCSSRWTAEEDLCQCFTVVSRARHYQHSTSSCVSLSSHSLQRDHLLRGEPRWGKLTTPPSAALSVRLSVEQFRLLLLLWSTQGSDVNGRVVCPFKLYKLQISFLLYVSFFFPRMAAEP